MSKIRAAATQNTIAVLADRFPDCFAVFQERRAPLKLGIHHDINATLNGAASAKEIARALRWYTGNAGYLRACVEGAPRIDLNGNPAGTVTADHAAKARERLAQYPKVRAKAKAKHPPKQAAAPAPAPRRLGLADLRAAARARRQLTPEAAE